jgi:GNAT superfamily N-acetyltransferase
MRKWKTFVQSRSNELGTSVREALEGDAQRISALALQLGYEVPIAHVEQHLRRNDPDRAVMVAVVPRAGVVGWVSVAERRSLLSSSRADIEGLVVEDEYRGNGIGEMLVDAAEAWARRRGCTTLRLLSNVVRERAHEFYRRLGYDVLKTEYVFQKSL